LNSHEGPELVAANLRLGWGLLRAEWPAGVWLVGTLLPEVLRMCVFALIGSVVGGSDGLRYAVVGSVVLAMATTTVAQVTDVPVVDVELGTFRAVSLGRWPAFVQYLARLGPLIAMALAIAATCALVVGPLTGQPDLALPLLARTWMLLPAAASSAMLGLLVIAPAIGSSWEGITYNAATAVLTVTSGAVFAPGVPGLAAVGQLLPLTHTVTALRLSLAGRPWAGELALELLVGLGWGLLAALAYRHQVSRGRRTGRGAFAL
jgi:hypothetical protein